MALKTLLELDLSDVQRAEILTIMNQYEGEMEAIRQQSFEARKDLRRALRAEPFDEEGLRKALRGLFSIREESVVLGARMTADLRRVLTPEQQELLKKQRGQRLGRFQGQLDPWAEAQAD
jgi:Spy/CpxP family protein refolding chaperone